MSLSSLFSSEPFFFTHPIQWWRARKEAERARLNPQHVLREQMLADLAAAQAKMYAYRRQLESEEQDAQDTRTAIDTLEKRIRNITMELQAK